MIMKSVKTTEKERESRFKKHPINLQAVSLMIPSYQQRVSFHQQGVGR